jgi:hypothetical protein
MLAFVLFRHSTLANGVAMLGRMVVPHSGLACPVALLGFWLTAAVMLAAHLAAHHEGSWRLWERLPTPVRGFGYASLLIGALFLARVSTQAFIYFQF